LHQLWRKRPFRHHDAVELEHRVVGRVDERERAGDALFHGNSYKLPSLEPEPRRFDPQREQRIGPAPVLDHPAFEPFCGH
jgi:hypothetical protein